jgi:hypothetical protein
MYFVPFNLQNNAVKMLGNFSLGLISKLAVQIIIMFITVKFKLTAIKKSAQAELLLNPKNYHVLWLKC